MNSLPATGFGLALAMQMCGTDPDRDVPTSTGYSCNDYQIMLDVETYIAQECNTDADCTQPLDGTGCGCSTDDLIANDRYEADYFYEMYDEALGESCTIEFDTSCDCDSSAVPSCEFGTCVWR